MYAITPDKVSSAFLHFYSNNINLFYFNHLDLCGDEVNMLVFWLFETSFFIIIALPVDIGKINTAPIVIPPVSDLLWAT